MDINTLQQALKLQNDLNTLLSQRLVFQRTGKLPAIEVLLKKKEQLLTSAQAEVETAIKERDVTVKRWDERVAQRKANAANLLKEIYDLKDQLTKQKVASKDSATGKIKKEARAKKTR